MLRHAARPFQHVRPPAYRLGQIQPPLVLCQTSVAHQRRWKTRKETSRALAAAIWGGASDGTALAPYVNEVGRINGIHFPQVKRAQRLGISPKKIGASYEIMLYKHHVWRHHYLTQLMSPINPARELVLMQHLRARDVPLWVEMAVKKKNQIGIVRSRGSKRLKNIMREVLARRGFSIDGWPLDHSAKDKATGKGPVLWGTLELGTHEPLELATADFQRIVNEIDENLGQKIIGGLILPDTSMVGPEKYPGPENDMRPNRPNSRGSGSGGGTKYSDKRSNSWPSKFSSQKPRQDTRQDTRQNILQDTRQNTRQDIRQNTRQNKR